MTWEGRAASVPGEQHVGEKRLWGCTSWVVRGRRGSCSSPGPWTELGPRALMGLLPPPHPVGRPAMARPPAPGSVIVPDWHESAEGKEYLACILRKNRRRVFGLLERPVLPPPVAIDTASYKIFMSGKSGVGKTALVAKLAGLEVPVVHHETTGPLGTAQTPTLTDCGIHTGPAGDASTASSCPSKPRPSWSHGSASASPWPTTRTSVASRKRP
ncbi:ciliogenesis and planar polarity effector 2 isoform X3 [Vulpes vulpes]|uniref:Ciliogenesis and planar polarity effector 2 isoform X3 n=1 Tax=Vulpes vulpes TaxID=9627 RepID=A0ABM4ZXD2_VULVU